jgi:peptidyl-prolyl cis-trans isomerase B (cyclophilin B)
MALIVGVLALAAIVAIVLLTRGDDDGEGSEPTAAGGCEFVEKPEPKRGVEFDRPEQVIEPGAEATAVVETSCGTFEIALDTTRAPKTANSFAFLAEEGFYDGLDFHRIAPGFVIQGGDPLGTGSGGPGYFVDEKPPGNLQYTRGIVAMAKSATEPPGRSGSQFFVVSGAAAPLTPDYALVGEVTEGLDVVARIDKLGTPRETPKRTVLIESITIEQG